MQTTGVIKRYSKPIILKFELDPDTVIRRLDSIQMNSIDNETIKHLLSYINEIKKGIKHAEEVNNKTNKQSNETK